MKILITLLAGLLTSFAIHGKDYFDQPEQVTPLLPGMSIPEFTAKRPSGELVTFAPDALDKPFVLTFYRGGWCPYCNAHLGEMRLAEQQLTALGFEVYFISPDQPSHLINSLKDQELKANINYQLLSDADMAVARAFKIAFKVPAETVKKYQQWGIDLEQASGHDHHLLPAPATFLVGQDGVIQFQYVNPDYKIRLAPDILLSAAKDYLKRTAQ
jgi:peroxiredoxin